MTTPTRSRYRVLTVAVACALALITTGCQPKEVMITVTVVNDANEAVYVSGLTGHVVSVPVGYAGKLTLRVTPDITCISQAMAFNTTWTAKQDAPRLCDGDIWTITAPTTPPAYIDVNGPYGAKSQLICDIGALCTTSSGSPSSATSSPT